MHVKSRKPGLRIVFHAWIKPLMFVLLVHLDDNSHEAWYFRPKLHLGDHHDGHQVQLNVVTEELPIP
jgi:hypothetical protein